SRETSRFTFSRRRPLSRAAFAAAAERRTSSSPLTRVSVIPLPVARCASSRRAAGRLALIRRTSAISVILTAVYIDVYMRRRGIRSFHELERGSSRFVVGLCRLRTRRRRSILPRRRHEDRLSRVPWPPRLSRRSRPPEPEFPVRDATALG